MSIQVEKEIPVTNDGLYAYLEEANKRIKYLKPFVNEFNRLKIRIKACKDRLDKHTPGGK